MALIADGIHNRQRVGATLRMNGAQHSVDMRDQTAHGLVGIQPHRGNPKRRQRADYVLQRETVSASLPAMLERRGVTEL